MLLRLLLLLVWCTERAEPTESALLRLLLLLLRLLWLLGVAPKQRTAEQVTTLLLGLLLSLLLWLAEQVRLLLRLLRLTEDVSLLWLLRVLLGLLGVLTKRAEYVGSLLWLGLACRRCVSKASVLLGLCGAPKDVGACRLGAED